MDNIGIGYSCAIGQAERRIAEEVTNRLVKLKEPTNYHDDKNYENNLDWRDRLEIDSSFHEFNYNFPHDYLAILLSSNLFRTSIIQTVYEKIRISGKIKSIRLNGFLNHRISRRDEHGPDAIKLLEYVTHYNKNVSSIYLDGFDLDIVLLTAIFKIKTLTGLHLRQCKISPDVFFILVVCLFENSNRAEYLQTYFKRKINSPFESDKRDLLIIFSEINDFKFNLKRLNLESCQFPEENSLKQRKRINNGVVRLLETNCHLRVLNFPKIGLFIDNPYYKLILENNFSIITTNMVNTSLITERNEKILEMTRKCCLTLIGIKKLRWNNSPEFKNLGIVDNNIVKMIGFYVFYELKNNREHLKLLATKL
jgi:hypothetical protein